MVAALPQRTATAPPLALVLLVRRWGAEWRVLVALFVTAALSATALAAFAQLGATTEGPAVRAAIADLPAASASVDVEVVRPAGDVADLRRDVARAVAGALRTAAPSSGATALSQQVPTAVAGADALVTLAATDRPGDVARLESGRWPRAGRAEAAVPAPAARALGLRAGDRVRPATDSGAPTLTITGVYRIRPSAALWRVDPLAGAGEDPAYVAPDSTAALPQEAFGPLLTTLGALGGTPLQVVDLSCSPDLTGTAPAQLRRAAARVEGVDDAVATAVGSGSLSIGITSGLPDALRRLARGLDAARAPVAVAAGLLAALTVAVLLGMARLVAAGRVGEQQLLASRGAGRGRLAALVVGEALVAGVLVALAAGLLAGPAGALVAGGAVAPSGAAAWTAAALSGAAVAAVLVAAAVRPEDRDRSGRAPRLTAAARSGADLAVAALAAVLVQRLVAVPGPPSGLALAAPVLVLVAAALLGRRLVAPLGRLAEPLAARSRSLAGALAAFELSRRARRSTAAVLVIALGLGTAAFALVQLATWDGSQRAQAAFAVGAPARTSRGPATAPLVIRTAGLLAATSADAGGTASVGLMALPASAAALLAEADDPAARAVRALRDPAAAHEVALPAGTRTLRVALPVATRNAPRPESSTLTALLRGPDGLVLRAGSAVVGRAAEVVDLALPASRSLRLAGLDLDFPTQEREVRLPIASVSAAGSGGTVRLAAPTGWGAVQTDGTPAVLLTPQGGFADVIGQPVPGPGRRSAVRLVAWTPGPVPLVVDAPAARPAGATRGADGRLLVAGQVVPVVVDRVVPRLPASLPVPELRAGGAVSRGSVAAVDREALQRAVVERGGVLTGEPQERWTTARSGSGSGVDVAGLTAVLRDAPLRVAVRPALALTAAAGVLLAVLAFLAQTAAARRDRRFDLAQLRAAGAGRSTLAAIDLLASGAQLAIGAAVGVPAGLLAALLVATRVVTDPVGGPPVPAAVLDLAPAVLVPVVAGTALAVLVIVGGTALAASRRGTAALIRTGGEP